MTVQHNMLLITGAACTALLFIQSGIPFTIRKWLKLRRLKPFDCEFCLAFWLCFFSSSFRGVCLSSWPAFLSSIYFEKNWLETIYISAMASILAVFINKKLNS